MNQFDRDLFHWINRWPEWMNPTMQFFSRGLDSVAMKIVLVVTFIALVSSPKTRRCGLIAGLLWPIANGLTDLAKLIPFARPGNEISDAIIRVGMSPSMGTASAHSANMAFVAFVLTYYLPRLGVFWVLIAILTGLSRIYVAAHYPSQVLFGWTIGVASAAVVVVVIERLWPRPSQSEPEPEPESAAAAV